MIYSTYSITFLIQINHSKTSPFSGGAFFSDITNVATAFNTKDISDNLYLQKERDKSILKR